MWSSSGDDTDAMSTPIRYVVVQLLAYGIDIGSFAAIMWGTNLAAPYANVVAKIAAGTFAFFAHRHVTFNAASHGRVWDQAVRYIALLLLNSFGSSILLVAVLYVLPHPVAAKIMSDVMLIIITFSLSKTFIFGRRQSKAEHRQP